MARNALEEHCRIYWRPVFVFVCRRGYSTEDAQDLTQDFFLMILEDDWLQHADANRGRFRSLLLTSLQNFLVNAAERRHTRKRGGGVEFVSWDDWMADAPAGSRQISIRNKRDVFWGRVRNQDRSTTILTAILAAIPGALGPT